MKMKCRHKVIAGIFHYHGQDDEGLKIVEKTCSNCCKVYKVAGGLCKFCTTAVAYCSRNCQVQINLYLPFKINYNFFQELHWEVHRLDCSKTQKYMKNTAKFLYDNEKIPDKSILKVIKQCNANETLNGSGWPRTFSPMVDKCPKCSIILSPVTKKKGKTSDDHSLLITMDHILEVDIYTKQCKICCHIVKPETSKLGLLNIGDLYLVTLDVFFTLQNTIRLVTHAPQYA